MRLEVMANNRFDAAEIARRLRRSEAAVRNEARRIGVTLPTTPKQLSLTEKRPYGASGIAPRRAASPDFEPRRSAARASAPGRPARSRAQHSVQDESLF